MFMICHHSPGSIRPIRSRTDHHSPLTSLIPASEVTIHERRHPRLCCHKLGSHGDHGCHCFPTPAGTDALSSAGLGGLYFRCEVRGLRTRDALLAPQASLTNVNTLFRCAMSKWESNTINRLAGGMGRRSAQLLIPTLLTLREGRPRLRRLVMPLPRRWARVSPNQLVRHCPCYSLTPMLQPLLLGSSRPGGPSRSPKVQRAPPEHRSFG